MWQWLESFMRWADYLTFAVAVILLASILLAATYELSRAIFILLRRIARWLHYRLLWPRLAGSGTVEPRRFMALYWTAMLSMSYIALLLVVGLNTLPQDILSPWSELPKWVRAIGVGSWMPVMVLGISWGIWDGLNDPLPAQRRQETSPKTAYGKG
ncbi:MAG TPA: hypothetical protein VHI93_01125 [Candidatus Thermoplasmatota archaeon]|nr:hypothetical protein [Candidatus Thermoplasmatota archaeon]